MHFIAVKNREKVFFLFRVSKTLHLQQLEGIQSSKLGM